MNREEYMKAIIPAMQLVVKKGEDYNTGVTLQDYFPFKDRSYVQMLHMKCLRLRSLLANDKPPNFESVQDTLDDLINYAVFYRLYLMEANNV